MDTCTACGGLVAAKGERLHCYGCGADYGLSKVQEIEPKQEALLPPIVTLDDSLDDTSRNKLGEIHRALDKSNEHLQKIREYMGWFFWIFIGIPLVLIIIGVWFIALNNK